MRSMTPQAAVRSTSKAVGVAGGDAGCGAVGGVARMARSQQHHGPRGWVLAAPGGGLHEA